MDLVKIGSYIAEKRKKLGMTQKQLAEKLGKSDKSVSKWERGICLQDVSVKLELCEILGISLNEFLAGEDREQKHDRVRNRARIGSTDPWRTRSEFVADTGYYRRIHRYR